MLFIHFCLKFFFFKNFFLFFSVCVRGRGRWGGGLGGGGGVVGVWGGGGWAGGGGGGGGGARIGQIVLLLLLVDNFGPIRDTIKSAVATTRIERMKKKP